MKTELEQDIVRSFYQENEKNTNRTVFFILLAIAAIGPIDILLNLLDESYALMIVNRKYIIPESIALVLLNAYVYFRHFEGKYIKYIMITSLIFVCFSHFFLFSLYSLYFIFIPILVSIRYFDRRITLHTLFCMLFMFIVTIILGLILEHDPIIHDFHEWVSDNFWRRWQDTLVYVFIPVTIIGGIYFMYGMNISNTGHRLLESNINQVLSMKKIEMEMSTASQVQLASLPEADYDTEGKYFSVRAWEKTAKNVGGDFYDYYLLYDNVLAVVIADVSDKGLPAALFMMSAKKAIYSALSCSRNLEEAIQLANHLICTDNKFGMFLTLWIGLIDIRTGEGKYVNAGHLFPLLKHKDGNICELTNDPDLFLGNFEDISPKVHTFHMHAGDLLLLYTDGITDARNVHEVSYGTERLIHALKDAPNHADGLRKTIIQELTDFTDDATQFDDMTFLILQCNQLVERDEQLLTLPLEAKSATIINDTLEEMLTKVDCPQETRRDIAVIVDEICTNIVDYADTDSFTCGISIGTGAAKMVFVDGGAPFDPLEHLSEPDTEVPQLGGLGIFLVSQLSDEMKYRYENGNNILTVKKLWNL